MLYIFQISWVWIWVCSTREEITPLLLTARTLLLLTNSLVTLLRARISSGGSMLDVAKQLKERHAKRVFVCTTYGLFTDGLAKFDEYYEKGWMDRVITTNLNYRIPELLDKPYYIEANMSKYLASIMDIINHDVSVEKVRSSNEKIMSLMKKINAK